jgi:hypothetical protein
MEPSQIIFGVTTLGCLCAIVIALVIDPDKFSKNH